MGQYFHVNIGEYQRCYKDYFCSVHSTKSHWVEGLGAGKVLIKNTAHM